MDKETFLSKIAQLGTIEDDVERRTILTEISDGVSTVYDNVETLNTDLTKANEDLEKAQKANMDYFLKIEEQKSKQEINKNNTGIEEEPPKVYKDFKDIAKEFIK